MAAAILASDNQCGLNLTAPPSTRGAGAARIFDVPLLRPTAANLRGMGRPLTGAAAAATLDIAPFPRPAGAWRPLVPGTGVGGGEVAGVFTCGRSGDVVLSTNVGLGRNYVIGWYGDDPAAAAAAEGAGGAAAAFAASDESVLTHEANFHADGGQIVAVQPTGGAGGGFAPGVAFVLLLAPAGDDVRAESFRAFLVDPAHDGVTGIHIDAGTWHQPAFALGGAGAASAVVLDNRQGQVHSCVSVSFVHEFGGYLRVPLSRAAVAEPAPPPPLPPKPPRLGYTILYVQGGVAQALAFYERGFGLRRRFLSPDGAYGELATGATALAFCDAAHARTNFAAGPEAGAVFAPAARGHAAPAMNISFVVQDVDAAYARALAAGAAAAAAPATKPWGHRVAYVRDAEGFLVELCGELEEHAA